MSELDAQSVRGYELREHIGEGGFGAVYRAYQPVVDREVAIKVILSSYVNQPAFIRRFEVEAQLIAKLEHVNIVPLYDYWRDSTGAFLVMRFLRGGSLRSALSRGPLPLDTLLDLFSQISAALAHAHRRDVVHRDLKPDNILLDEDGNAYLADFGIAMLIADGKTRVRSSEGMVGTPTYIAPEQITSQPVSPQTDIYSLGIMLYEMLTGVPPFPDDTPISALISKQLHEPLPSVLERRPDLPAAIDEVIQRATVKTPDARYPDVLSLAADLRRAVLPKTVGVPVVTERPGDEAAGNSDLVLITDDEDEVVVLVPENPYKGLRAFQEADAADFFGREALVGKLLARLAGPAAHANFLAVVGPSGSGKSSVVRAGLIPALRRGAIPGSEGWFVVEMFPGDQPFEVLSDALLKVAIHPPGDLLEQVQKDVDGLRSILASILPDDGTRLVLFIDQFEELFTLVTSESVRQAFVDSLARCITQPDCPLSLIVTLRADFYDRPLLYPAFGKAMRDCSEVILPLEQDELARAIVRPAENSGVSFEKGLDATVIADLGEQPGSLPLLQYALTELFEQREGDRLTLRAYQHSGGVLGALARRADEVYGNLDARGKETARQLFLRLVTPGEGIQDTRRRILRSEIATLAADRSTLEGLIDELGKYRLLSFSRDPETRSPTIEIAHEALIRTWQCLRTWIETSRDHIHTQRLLTAATVEWTASGKDPGFLMTGSRLEQFERWSRETDLALSQDERQFLAASVAEREKGQAAERERQAYAESLERRSRNRLRLLLVVMAAATVVALVLSGLAIGQRQLALDAAATANANFARAESQRLATQADEIMQANTVNSDLAALLSIRAIKTMYTYQADAALLRASRLNFAIRVFGGHTGSVKSVAFSPDGKTAATGSADSSIRLWEVSTGKTLHTLTGHTGAVNQVVFSPDGKWLASAGSDDVARLWDVQTGQEVRQFAGHKRDVLSVAFSPDGSTLATGSMDTTVRLWDVQTGHMLRQFAGHTRRVNTVVFSGDGHFILSGSTDTTARLWDVSTGQPIRVFSGHKAAVLSAAFSPNGKYILTGGADWTAYLWDINTGATVNTLVGHLEKIAGVAFSPDGTYLLTGSASGAAWLWKPDTTSNTAQYIGSFGGHTAAINSVAFSSDGKSILTGSDDMTARLWSISSPAKQAFVVDDGETVNQAVFSPDGSLVLTGGRDGIARLWNAQTQTVIQAFPGHGGLINTVAFSPDGKTILVAGADRAVQFYDPQTGKLLRAFEGHTGAIFTARYSPDGSQILAGGENGEVFLWDAQSGQILQTYKQPPGSVIYAVAFTPDGKLIATAGGEGVVQILDKQSAAVFQTLLHNQTSLRAVHGIAFSPDGKLLATVSEDKAVRLWEVSTGKLVRTLTGHQDEVYSVAFSPDGTQLVTASWDKTARLWSTDTGAVKRIFIGHTGPLTSVTFSPDGTLILTASRDASAQTWNTVYSQLLTDVCSKMVRDLTDAERSQYDVTEPGPTCP